MELQWNGNLDIGMIEECIEGWKGKVERRIGEDERRRREGGREGRVGDGGRDRVGIYSVL
jgi:hypothetical protein